MSDKFDRPSATTRRAYKRPTLTKGPVLTGVTAITTTSGHPPPV
jgi:hypothetical protein